LHGSRLVDHHAVAVAPDSKCRHQPRQWVGDGVQRLTCMLRWFPALLLCGLGHSYAQSPPAAAKPSIVVAQSAQSTPPPGTPVPAETPSGFAPSQSISVQAGTGVLLRLPQPAATVMSAEPAVARVQPASPTSLFLMGVAPGRTTVIATTDAGAAIVQYNVTVSPGAGGQSPTAAAVGGGAPGTLDPQTLRAIRAAIERSVQGASRSSPERCRTQPRRNRQRRSPVAILATRRP
jgi:hypothetical protein